MVHIDPVSLGSVPKIPMVSEDGSVQVGGFIRAEGDCLARERGRVRSVQPCDRRKGSPIPRKDERMGIDSTGRQGAVAVAESIVIPVEIPVVRTISSAGWVPAVPREVRIREAAGLVVIIRARVDE